MFTSETLSEVIDNQEVTFTLRFNHAGIVDADYAKQFITLVNCGIIAISTKIKKLPQLEAQKVETATNNTEPTKPAA